MVLNLFSKGLVFFALDIISYLFLQVFIGVYGWGSFKMNIFFLH